MLNRPYARLAAYERTEILCEVYLIWEHSETMHTPAFIVVALRDLTNRRNLRLIVEGVCAQLYTRLGRRMEILLEWGVVKKIYSPNGQSIWEASASSSAVLVGHYCGHGYDCSHWSHFFDREMTKVAMELYAQYHAKDSEKLRLADLVDRYFFMGRSYWIDVARRSYASFYVHAPEDTGEEFRYFLIQSIPELPTRHSHWLDGLVQIGIEKCRPVFGLPREGTSDITLRAYLAQEGVF